MEAVVSNAKVRVAGREIVDPILQYQFDKLFKAVTVGLEASRETMAEEIRNHRGRMTQNSRTSLSRLTTDSLSGDRRRDLNDECGYPTTEQITLNDYRELYHRNSVAQKVVDILPRYCWRYQPTVTDTDDPTKETAFTKALSELVQGLRGTSRYKGNDGNPLWDALGRLDKLAGRGHYGTMLIGVAGEEGADLSKPLEFRPSKKPTRKVIYLKVFPEDLCPVNEFNDDTSSDRYRLPESYQVSFENLTDLRVTSDSAVRPSLAAEQVHWTRLIHVIDGKLGDDTYGVPRMRPVLNRLYDLDKLYGGSAEMYYKGAMPGWHWGTHPQLGGDVTVDYDALRSQMENFFNGLQRYTATVGMEPTSLAPQVVDPSPQIDVQLEAVCMYLDCPKRIFLGSERGELASSQDTVHWNDVVHGRNKNYVTPNLIVPLIDRFINLGVLPEVDEFMTDWPEVDTMTEDQKADRAVKLTQAIVQYITGGGFQVMPLAYWLEHVIGLDRETITGLIDELTSPDPESDDDLTAYGRLTSPPEVPEPFDEEGGPSGKADKSKPKAGDTGKGKGKKDG